MSEIEIKVDLDLDPKKAKTKLDDFKQLAEKEGVEVKLDLKGVKEETKQLKNVLANAFKIDNKTLGDLKQVEKSLKQINELIKLQTKNNVNIDTINSNEKLKILKEEQKLRGKLAKEEEKLRKNAESQRAKSIKEYLSVTNKINDIESSIYKNSKDGNVVTNNSLREQISLLRERQAVLSMDIRSNGGISNEIKQQIEYQEKLQRAIQETKRLSVDEKVNNKSTQQLETMYKELNKIQDKLISMQNTKGFLDNDLVEKTNSLLSETRSKLDANGLESDFKSIGSVIDLLNNNLKNLNTGNTLSRQEASFNVLLRNMENRIESFKNAIKDLNGSDDVIQRLENSFRGIDTSNIERAAIDLRRFGNELKQTQREMKQVESNSRTFFGNFGQEFRDNLFTFTAGELLADGIRNVAHSLKELVLSYDQAWTDLKKVANPEDIMNASQLDAIGDKAIQIAKNTGKSSQDTIKAIADTVQMAGLGMQESIMVAEQTMKLANVTGMTQELASQGVVTMLSSFNLDPLKEIPIVVDGVTKSTNEMVNAFDMINHVGNNFAISSDGILDAIQSGANVLATYGVKMTDVIAMITASNASLQDTSRVGNGLKTIAVNLAGIKSSADTGELSLNKCAKTLKEVAKIDIFEDEKSGKIKDMAKVMDELASKWESFTDMERSGISEAIAGKQQAAVFQSLMSNFDVMKQVQQELGSGLHFQSMEKENAQYVDSIAGKLNKLKETWVSVFNTIFSSDATKGILDGLIAISEAIADVVSMLDKTGMLTPVLMGLGVMLASKAFTGLPNLFKGGESSAKGFANVLPSITRGFASMNPPVTQFGASMVGVGTNLALAGGKVGGFLATAASFIPWAIGGAVAVGGLMLAVDHFTESLDEEKQRLNETISARKEEIASIDEQKGKLQEIQEEYDTLSNKPQKTAEEVSRLTELTKQLAEIRPDLVVGTDSNGNPILSMTGDVKDLIKEMDRATESKKKLLSVEQEDLAKNSIKQLHGSNHGAYSDAYGYANNANSEMAKLENMTSDHIMNMNRLEKDRDKILNKLYDSTGKERQKILKDLEKANYNIEKEQSDFAQKYQQQLDVVKEYSDKIGEGIFASLENSSTFKGMDAELQGKFSNLKNSLDFSDIKTEDELLEVEMALSNLMKAAANGDVNIDKISKSLEKANTEFAKTGDAEKYGQAIDKIISDLEKATGKDFSMLKDVFEGMDTSILKGKDALDEFLRAYGKTKADLDNNDGFAKALANQKRQIEQAIEELNGITGDAELDLELAYNIINNNELPMQLRDMVRVLLNKGHNSTEVVKFAQELLVDISDGKINIEEANKKIEDKFGEGAFEITPEILLSDDTKIAGIERVIEQLTDKFGEVPPVVKTVIEAEGITAYSQARLVLETYNSIPEEVRTTMSTNGLETLSDIINVQNMLELLPTDVVMNIVSNFPDVISGAGSVQEIINSLPSSVLLEIQSNYPEVVEKSKLLQDAIDKIPTSKESVVSVKEEVEKSPNGIFDRLFGKGRDTMTATAVINAQVNNLQALEETENIINRLTGGRSGGSSGGSSSGGGRSVDTPSVEPLNDFNPMSRAAKSSGGSSSGGGHSVTINVDVNGEEELQTLQSILDKFTIRDVNATITINTALAAQNLSGLITRINQTKQAISTMQGKTINIITALAAQNLSGLIVRVNQYKSAISSTPDKTINVHTAQAAKNISGLIAKIQQCNNTKPKPITFTAYTAQAAKNISGLIRKINSVPTSKSIKFSISQSGSIPNMGGKSIIPQPSSENIVKTYNVSNEVVDVSNVDSVVPISDVTSPELMSKATIKTPIEVTGKNVSSSLKYSIELLQELENRIKDVANQLSILDKKMKHATGKEKLKYLEEQNALYQEQLRLQKELEVKLKEQQNHTKNFLLSKGFQFTSDGNLKNYEEKLIAMEKEAERLENIASKDKASDKQKKASENYKKNLDEIKKYLNEYIQIAYEELPGVAEEFININNAIQDNIDSIKDLQKEFKDLDKDSGYKNHDRDIKSIENLLKKNEILLEQSSGDDKNKLLQERLELTKKLQKELGELIEYEIQQKETLMKELGEFGFTFRDDGSIVDYGNKIKKLKETLSEDDFDNVFKIVEEYLDLSLEKIPDLESEWLELNKTIKDGLQSVKDLKSELKDLNIDSGYKNHERDLAEIENLLDKNEILLNGASGSEYTDLLNKRIELIKRYQKELQELIQYENSVRNGIMGELGQYGFSFRDDGSIVNYGNIIAQLKQNLSEEEFKKVFAKVEEYLDLTFEKIPGLENDWLELNNEIKEHQDKLEELARQRALDLYLNKIKDIENEYDKLADRLDIVDVKLKHAFGKEKLDLLDEQIAILEEQKKKQEQLEQEYKSMLGVYKVDLEGFGIEFDSKGDITNLDEILNKHIDSADYEKLKKLVDEYLEIQRDKLPDVEKEWESLNSQIKDAYKEQLEVTKEIEDKIKDVYKKQIEERKKLIDEELEHRLKALKKEQDAYNDARKEADYQKDYDKQLGVIEDLQSQLDIAMRDNSLSGQKKVQELLKQLREEQEKLEEMVQDKIDDQVNDMFDKESNRLEQEAENAKDELDDKYSDEKLQQIVKDALTNGVFTDIDGNIKDLGETLKDFEDKFGDGMTAIGEIIKSELITNLEIAKETMKEFDKILGNLNLNQFKQNFSADINKSIIPQNIIQSDNPSIQFNSPLMVVQGNVTRDVVDDLKSSISNLKNQITKDIIKHIKS